MTDTSKGATWPDREQGLLTLIDPEIARCFAFVRSVTLFRAAGRAPHVVPALPYIRQSSARLHHGMARRAAEGGEVVPNSRQRLPRRRPGRLAAAQHHAQQLKGMELAVSEFLAASTFAESLPSNMTVTVGGTSKLDHEYQPLPHRVRWRCVPRWLG